MKFSGCDRIWFKMLATVVFSASGLWGPGGPTVTAQTQVPQKTDRPVEAPEPDEAELAKRRAEAQVQREILDKTLPKLDSIIPEPEVAVPEDPPPHEGAWFNFPLRMNPPDLLLVEVLEALPGRPITGERLIRPDGTITLGFYGDLQVRDLTLPQLKIKVIWQLRKVLDDEALGLVGEDTQGKAILIQPQDSDRVFVDLASYNSLTYYIQGDVNAPGRLPWTGHETIHDALIHAGHLGPLADLSDIKLYRPARGAKPARTYKIDYQAIRHGDKQANLQIFPGDRIEVGRAAIVKSTITLDRVAAPLNTWAQMVLQLGLTIKHMDQVIDKAGLSPDQRRQVYAELLQFLVDAAKGDGQSVPDTEAIRNRLGKVLGPILEAAPRSKSQPGSE